MKQYPIGIYRMNAHVLSTETNLRLRKTFGATYLPFRGNYSCYVCDKADVGYKVW